MSLILDALKRAEQERNASQSLPPERITIVPATLPKLPVTRWLIEALVIICIVAVLVYSTFSDKSPPNNQQPYTSNNATMVSNNLTDESKKLIQKQAVVTTSPTLAEDKKIVVAPKNSSNPAINKLYQEQTNKTKTTPIKKAKTPTSNKKSGIPKTSTPANETTTDPTLAIFLSMPLLTKMSARFQQSIPSIEYSLHVYSKKAGTGFVKLNGKSVRIGDQIAPKLILIKILENSIVLDHNGIQFQMLALESWMNFG